jgi:hypothetical protein
MARTTKDRPMWVERNDPANWVGEDHFLCLRGDWDCDIDVPLTAASSYGCHHEMVANHPWNRWWSDRPSRQDQRDRYWAPERTHVRESLTELVKQHRAGVEVNDSAAHITDQHHHGTFGGGGWD